MRGPSAPRIEHQHERHIQDYTFESCNKPKARARPA